MPPDPESAKAAVETLRHELDMTVAAMDATDRKAALIPAALGAIAGLFIAPDTTFSRTASVVLIAALAAAMIAGYHALLAMRAQRFRIGPDATRTAELVHLGLAQFNWGVARSLATGVKYNQDVAGWKSRHLNLSLFAAGIAILLLAGARIVEVVG